MAFEAWDWENGYAGNLAQERGMSAKEATLVHGVRLDPFTHPRREAATSPAPEPWRVASEERSECRVSPLPGPLEEALLRLAPGELRRPELDRRAVDGR